MDAEQFRQAIRDNQQVLQHEEFLGNVMKQNNRELLELYLDSDPGIVDRMHFWSGIAYPESPELVQLLLDRGLDPNRADWTGKTFLHGCAAQFDTQSAEVFLNAGADVNAKDVQYQETPLTTACRIMPDTYSSESEDYEDRRTNFIRLLLKHGAAVELPDDRPWASPLSWARTNGLDEVVQLLTSGNTE